MSEIKLFIGPEFSEKDKATKYIKQEWIPTLDGVQNVISNLKGLYEYKTILIFEKVEANLDVVYPMTSDIIYTTSVRTQYTQHYGTELNITITSENDVQIGSYYYSYLVMYSNTLDVWNVTPFNVYNPTLKISSKYILFDQTNVVLEAVTGKLGINQGSGSYLITKNVHSLTGDYVELEHLVIPNQMSEALNYGSLYGLANKTFTLFNILENINGQEIESFNGLLYTIGQEMLIAVPKQFQLDTGSIFRLSDDCYAISSSAFNDGVNYYPEKMYRIYGNNVAILADNCFSGLGIQVISFSNLQYIGHNVLTNITELTTFYLPASLIRMYDDSLDADLSSFIYVNFGNGLGTNLTSHLYLQNNQYLNIDNLVFQFSKLATITKGSKTIYLHSDVYYALTPLQITVASDKGWMVDIL